MRNYFCQCHLFWQAETTNNKVTAISTFVRFNFAFLFSPHENRKIKHTRIPRPVHYTLITMPENPNVSNKADDFW